MSSMVRSTFRKMARKNMEKAGYHKICKPFSDRKKNDKRSYFATNWTKFI